MSEFPPIPGSPFMLDHVLGLLFILHLIFVNYVLAAPWVIAWYALVKGEDGRIRARWMAAALPPAFTFTINLGVACLLFVQVLFSRPFFTANILLGNTWLSVIGLLFVSFSAAYVIGRLLAKPGVSTRLAGVVALLVGGATWAVAVIMITNYFVTASPSHWNECVIRLEPFAQNPDFLPRALHYAGGSFAVTGFWMVWMAWWRSKSGPRREVDKLRRQGLQLAASATAFQVIAGIWQLIALPVELWDRLFSGAFISVVWIGGVITGLCLLVVLIIACLLPAQLRWQKLATGLLMATLFGMVAGRELIRQTSFGETLRLRELPFSSQGNAMLAFVLILLAGGGFAVWALWQLFRLRIKAAAVTDSESENDEVRRPGE